MKLAGIVLIVLGIVACIYQWVPITQTHQDAKIGSLTIQHEETNYYPVTIAGVVAIIAGVGCVFAGARR